ncbi:MAG: amino acid ABC transporter substrate-binding protein [Treponemataceae bacterium]|nr:amino acid ABC transporter substrate-binding protein [Treponemataceae bacterium]
MKKLASLILALCLLLSITGCKKKTNSTGAVKALQDRGVFVLGLDDSFPPLGFRDNDTNEITGYDIDLAKEVAKRLNVEFKAQPISWDAKEMELSTGKIDCIWNGFTITEERKNQLSFTEAYLNNEQVLVVRADSGIKSLADMKGKILGIQSGSSAQEAVDDNPTFASSIGETIYFKDNITALNDLDIGGVDAVVMDSIVANYSIAQTKKPFVVVDEALANEAYGIGFRKNEPELRDKVWEVLKEMVADGTVEKISKKWFDKDISVIK